MTAMRTLRKRIKRSPSGQACVFVGIDDTRGIKFYRTEEERDDNYDLQKEIFDATGLACEPFEKFDAVGYFGFITERARPIHDGPTLLQKQKAKGDESYEEYIWEGIDNPTDYDFDDEDEEEEDLATWEQERREFCREITDLKRTIADATGIHLFDLHTANLGYVRGKLVPLDFDRSRR